MASRRTLLACMYVLCEGCAFGATRSFGAPYAEFPVDSLTEEQRELVQPLLAAQDSNALTEATYQCVLSTHRMTRHVAQHEATLDARTTRWSREELTTLRDLIDRSAQHCERALSSSETLPRDRALAQAWADRGRARIAPFENGWDYTALAPFRADLELAESLVRGGKAAQGLFLADELRSRVGRLAGVRPTVIVARLNALEALDAAAPARAFLTREPLASALARRARLRFLLAQPTLRPFERGPLAREESELSQEITATLSRFDAELQSRP
jgi:hypothetical protein